MTQAFNPNDHLIQLQGGKDYLQVAWRLVWFREQCPQGCITTELFKLELDRATTDEVLVWNNDTKRKEKIVKHAEGFVVFHAHVTDGKGGSATATKSEKAASFPDYIEKAETGAVGRALAMLGYGTQFTGDEFNEGERLADMPVSLERSRSSTTPAAEPAGAGAAAPPPPEVSKDQALHELAKPGPARIGKQGLVNGDGSEAQPRPYTVAEVKALFGKLYNPKGWPTFVAKELGMPVDDEALSDGELDRLQAKLVETRQSMAR